MDLVYLDSDILGDSYDAKLCRKRFIRYAQDLSLIHIFPVDCTDPARIDVESLAQQIRERMNA